MSRRTGRRATPGGGAGVIGILAAVMLAGGTLLALGGPASARDPGASAPERVIAANAARGIVDLGLERSDPDGPCRGYGYEIRTADGAVACTHGPDPAPDGIDVHNPRSLEQLQADLARTDAAMPALVDQAVAGAGSGGSVLGAPSDTVPCVGYGSAGYRVQAIYARVAGQPNRYAEVEPMIQGWARQTDDIFDVSAGQTAGSRHLRWVHRSDCSLAVGNLTLSANAVDDLGVMMSELAAAGYNRADRRYLVWFDVDYLCGVALTIPDDRPGQDNPNNGRPTGFVHFGRVDTACWGVPAPENQVEAHELTHTLGAVQFSAPNTSSITPMDDYWGHCVDEYDTMCYQAGTPKPMVYRCPASNERFLDCQHNDYFHTNPPAGSYLATHWNSAMSRFLVRVDPYGGFLDVSGSIFREDIAWISRAAITTGCTPDGERYCEATTVTREQMASFLARAMNLPAATRDFFTDDESSIHEADINRVAQAGIASGCGAGRFCPRATVTRQQMASFLARALRLPPATRDHFTDDGGSIHQADINRVAEAGVAQGCGGGRYCPTQTVNRGQMAAFLHRAFAA